MIHGNNALPEGNILHGLPGFHVMDCFFHHFKVTGKIFMRCLKPVNILCVVPYVLSVFCLLGTLSRSNLNQCANTTQGSNSTKGHY